MSANRPGWALYRDLELDDRGCLIGNFHLPVDLPVRDVNLGNIGFMQVFATDGEHVPNFAVGRLNTGHARHCLLREDGEGRKTSDHDKRHNNRAFHLIFTP